jgi:hypothetical protein
MVTHSGQPPYDLGNALQRPQIAGKMMHGSAFQQRLLDLVELGGCELAVPTDRTAGV